MADLASGGGRLGGGLTTSELATRRVMVRGHPWRAERVPSGARSNPCASRVRSGSDSVRRVPVSRVVHEAVRQLAHANR